MKSIELALTQAFSRLILFRSRASWRKKVPLKKGSEEVMCERTHPRIIFFGRPIIFLGDFWLEPPLKLRQVRGMLPSSKQPLSKNPSLIRVVRVGFSCPLKVGDFIFQCVLEQFLEMYVFLRYHLGDHLFQVMFSEFYLYDSVYEISNLGLKSIVFSFELLQSCQHACNVGCLDGEVCKWGGG